MTIFRYDKTFEGLLTVVFEAYAQRLFPDILLAIDEPAPLFVDAEVAVVTDSEKAARVWKGLTAKVSRTALSMVTCCWLSELPQSDDLLFRFLRKTFDAPKSVEVNFADPDVLELSRIGRRVSYEKQRMLMFLRFQKADDGTYFAPIEPVHNVLPLTISHFQDRFADQRWLIYDLKRRYGYYYDLKTVTEVTLDSDANHLLTGILDDELMAKDEQLFQQLWKTYFSATAIRERSNPRKQRHDMPVRYWKHLTEKR